jgi:glycine/D-amino acid oxidase-like deaminating enzyme/nitrite reductase/ring-hydroxylating ferredoxin subunit
MDRSERYALNSRPSLPKLPGASQSLWIAQRDFPRFPQLAGTAAVDVVIVGAGITGLTAAFILKQEGRKVAVVEALRVAEGVSGYTSAHLTEVPDCSYGTLLAHFGEKDGRRAVQAARTALDTIEHLARGAAAFRRLPGYYYAPDGESSEDVREELEAARRLGAAPILTDDVPLPFPIGAALRFEDQARFQPREYLLRLLEAIPGDGSFVFENTRVVDIEDGEPCVVETEHGVIKAADVVMATHVPLNRLFLQTKVAHYRSYVIGCEVAKRVGDALFWDNEDPYHYVRRAEIDGVSLLVVGGEDHKVGQEDDTDARFESLLSWAHDRFDVQAVRYRWSAQVAEPVDGLPYIGRNTSSSHVYVGTGYSGTGLTFGTLAAMISTDLIMGRPNQWADLYDATRVKPLAGAREFVAENVDFPLHLIGDRLKRAGTDALASVPPGRGMIVTVDGHKRAVYREESGPVRVLDPTCPHMGCLVAFNDAERSWDCPCHGSRFDTEGAVIDGPAVTGLKAEDPVRAQGE